MSVSAQAPIDDGNRMIGSRLPPGPRQPAVIQTAAFLARPISFFERARARFGKRFTVRVVGMPPLVMLSEPDQLRELFLAPPEVLHAGETARILEPVVGSRSLALLDEEPHLEQRKLMLPAFHGEKMQQHSDLMGEVIEREVARWPRDEAFALHPRLRSLGLEIILRTVFGLRPGQRLDTMRRLLTEILDFGVKPYSSIPWLQRDFAGHGPWARYTRLQEQVDDIVLQLIGESRVEHADGDSVLVMLAAARLEDGTPMSDQELRDQLMTLVIVGHETTASELAWAFACLAREPKVRDRLVREIDREGDGEYLTATINEILRRRPVLPTSQGRLVKKPIEIGGWTYPPDVCLIANAYLLHHDPDIYQDPYAFRPERFLDEQPRTYTWVPFGGGRRRCLGAGFATLQMKLVLRVVLSRLELRPASAAVEVGKRRSIMLSPRNGARIVLREYAKHRPAESLVR